MAARSPGRVLTALLALTAILVCLPAAAEPTAPALVIRNARVIDGTGASPRAATIVIRDGVIHAVSSEADPPVRGGERELDASGRWVIPGLIDLHQHSVGVTAPPAAWLAAGLTAVRDPGTDLERGRALRARIESGEIPGPRLFLGLFIDIEAGQTPSSVRDLIAREDARGLDLVKLYMRTPAAHADAAIAEAHARGLPVTWHLSLPLSVALGLGVDGVEHLYVFRELMPDYTGPAPATTSAAFHAIFARWARYLDPSAPAARALLGRLASSGTIWTPTLVLSERIALGQSEISAAWTPAEIAVALDGFNAACRMVGEAHRLGVAIGAGTDTTTAGDLHREIELLVRCGLDTRTALAGATRVAARALGRERLLGTLEPGKLADFLILDADPLRDIRRTADIWRVVKGGRVFDPRILSE